MSDLSIYYGSDLHLEFAAADFEIPAGDILILTGDVFVPHDIFNVNAIHRTFSFFEEVSEKFRHVYVILGNHEHYYGCLVDTREEAEDMLRRFPNVKILDGESVVHEDVAIFGGTLWTDFDGENPIAMYEASLMMNDFSLIGFSLDRINCTTNLPGKLLPEDLLEENAKYRKLLFDFLDANVDKKLVVATHHAPSYACVPECYKGSNLNPAYFNTRLDHVFDRPVHWIHGHVHVRYSMEYGNGAIYANPRGYPGENSQKYELKRLEIPG